jgi:hypothetical protein
VHLLRTFLSCRIQPLRQRATKMWLYPGSSCPDCSFSQESGDAEMNTRIHKVQDHGVDLNHRVGPAPLREGVASTRVSPFRSISSSLHNFILSSCS